MEKPKIYWNDHLQMEVAAEEEAANCLSHILMEITSENMNNNEFLPGCYTDLTFEAESGSIHSAPNRKSQDFFRGFHL